jgi:hypothetical protein
MRLVLGVAVMLLAPACDCEEENPDQCDPLASTPCAEGGVCEQRTDGTYGCFDPVRLRGMVFDLLDGSPIQGAHVSAADASGAGVTDVAITGADGRYELTVPVQRDPDGTPASGVVTLRAVAQDYAPFPQGIRPAMPVDAAADATSTESGWVVENATTDVGLLPLPADLQGLGSIAGTVHLTSAAATPGGVLIVVEGGTPPPPIAWSARSGSYRVFNVPAGSYVVHGYQAFAQLVPESVTLADGEHKTGVDLEEAGPETATIGGSINLVNPGDCEGTSIVLVPESTFDPRLSRGDVVPGLRAPGGGVAPNITGAWEIRGVPDGTYVVLAAFENDFCVRDPDPHIAGTQIVHQTVPDAAAGRTIELGTSFKVTGALRIISPGAEAPEPITGTPTFTWVDDSSEDYYTIIVYDAFGNEVWSQDPVTRVTGGDASLAYPTTAPALQDGMYYQWRVTSMRDTGPISLTEDLLGVFFL